MIWQEQRIRDDIVRKSSIPDSDASELVDEIDRLRKALRKIREEAQLQAMRGIDYLARKALGLE